MEKVDDSSEISSVNEIDITGLVKYDRNTCSIL